MATEKPALPPPPPTKSMATIDPKPVYIAPTHPPSPPTTVTGAIHSVNSMSPASSTRTASTASAAGTPPSNVWNYLGPEKVPDSNPVNRCQFSLFGLPSMLGSSWDDSHDAVRDIPSPQPSEQLAERHTDHNHNHISVPVDHTFSADDLETIDFLLSDPEFLQAMHHKSPADLPAATPHQDAPRLGVNAPVEIPSPAVTVTHHSTTSTPTQAAGSEEKAWRGPLHIAVQKGNDRIVRLLICHTKDCNERDSSGATPLYYAVTGGFETVVKTLVSHGARIGDVDEGERNALHWAVSERREGVLRALLELCCANTALINSYDTGGMTPLHMAIDNGFEAGVDLLLQYGADINYRARVP
ncbi:hypothetical protein PG991_002921 [Apiospora marii]|uniref:Uncharacterized protein n=2 Tax=Apiospora marii TaxID=335849 RepID=A0ABR1SGR3_9PEZI